MLDIFRATNAIRKYYHLLLELENMDQILIPESFSNILRKSSLHGVREASRDIEIISKVDQLDIIYVQPVGKGHYIINFHEFENFLQTKNDGFSERFAQSLITWANVKAGKGYLRNDG